MTRRTAELFGTNAFARTVDYFAAFAVAFCADRAGFAFAVDTFFAFAARRFRACTSVGMVFGFAIRFLFGTRIGRTQIFAIAVNAFLRCGTVVVRRTSFKIGRFCACAFGRGIGRIPVSQLYAFCDSE